MGTVAHAELYQLLSLTEDKFARAMRATVDRSGNPDVETARTIFSATLSAISHYKWEGSLPILGKYPGGGDDEALLPPPVLVALAYCLDSQQAVCLWSLHLTSGHSGFDRVILGWSRTLLRGVSAKMRFFYDLTESYDGAAVKNPLLSDTRTRAVQLLTIGWHLVSREKNKIGQPVEFHVY